MKRLHVHVAVDNIESSVGFYPALFGAALSRKRLLQGMKPLHGWWAEATESARLRL